MSRVGGVPTILPTPLAAQWEVDLASLERLTEFLVGLEVDGVVVLGVMGEAPKLSEAEQEDVITTTVAAAAGRIPVFAGSGAGGTDLAIRKSARAVELGAAGLLVAPPPVQSDGVILEYYRRIGETVEAPIVLHDYPAVTGIRLDAGLVARLFEEVPAVKAIKLEEPPTGPKITALRSMGSDIGIVGGLGGQYLLEELERGADGIMTGLSYPDILVDVYRRFKAGDIAGARSVFYGACPLLRFEFQPGVGLALRKEIYRRRGAMESAFVRHPGAQLDDRLSAELDAVLDHLGLLEVRA